MLTRRRIIATIAASLAVLAGAAPAASAHTRPYLTNHQARRAADAFAGRLGLVNLASVCIRRSRTVVDCDVDGFYPAGDPNGPVITMDDSWWDATGTEANVPVRVTLRGGRAHVDVR